jgi:phenylpropionate dioxygenase-like ring-hydroxylating dioxygenase large terminal subunit
MNIQTPVFRPTTKDDVAWLGTEPIPALVYYDPEYFELEREAVFKRTWLQIGHICELPDSGSFIRRDIEVARASVLIVRGKDGFIRAFHNVCVHRGTKLVNADAGRQASFSCPYHMWTYGTDGSLQSAPDFDNFFLEKSQCALKPVAMEVFAGLIFVHLGTPAQGVREWLGGFAEGFERLPIAQATDFVEYTYEIEANWKLTYDNFQENYHLRFVHPRTGGPGCTEENPFAYPQRYNFHGPHRSQTIWSSPTPIPQSSTQELVTQRILAPAMRAGLFNSELNMDFIGLFPNFTLFGLPIRQFTQTIMPLSVSRCRGTIRFYWVGKGESASECFAREYIMASQRDIHAEDRDIVEAGQEGLASGAIESINFQVQESLCRHLFNAVDAMVREYQAEVQQAS